MIGQRLGPGGHMDGVMPSRLQPAAQGGRQLGVDKKLHSAAAETIG